MNEREEEWFDGHRPICDVAGLNCEEGDCEMTFCICGKRLPCDIPGAGDE